MSFWDGFAARLARLAMVGVPATTEIIGKIFSSGPLARELLVKIGLGGMPL